LLLTVKTVGEEVQNAFKLGFWLLFLSKQSRSFQMLLKRF